jgi:hypothetical protein
VSDLGHIQRERQPAGAPARATPGADRRGAGHARLGRRLQSTMGNRAAAAVLQRGIDISLLVDTEDKRREVEDAGFTVLGLQKIHEDLKNKGTVAEHLRALEASVAEKFTVKESASKYTRALDAALFAVESTWTELPADAPKAARRTTIAKDQVLPTGEFLAKVRKGLPLKDVGAAISHGEHAHRIQWYVIARMLGAARTARLYRLLGSASFIVDLKPLAVEKKEQAEQQVKEEQGPPQQQEAPSGYRAYFRDRVLMDLYLWNAILDIPFSASGANNLAVGDVGYAAPVTVTKDLSEGAGDMAFSRVQQAILNRRLKRFYQNGARGDGELDRRLGRLGGSFKELHQLAAKLVIDYDARNVLAFGLAGIEVPDDRVRDQLKRYEQL